MTTNKLCWALSALVLILAIYAGSAKAEEKDHCLQISSLAESIMTGRQMGLPMSKMMGVTDLDLARTMVIEAYEHPRFSTEQVKKRAIGDFRDRWYLACVKAT